MGGEAQIIAWLQGGSCGFLDYLFFLLTQLGDELFFLLVGIVLYWCIDKRYAFKFVNVFLCCSVVVNGVKMIVRRPRPYDKYEGFVRSIGKKTGGYSFPSGHSASITNLSTQAYIKARKTSYARAALIGGIAVSLVVMLSRLYLGQHYITDVFAGAAIGIGSGVLFSYLFEFLKDNEHKICYGIFPVCVILTVIIFACGIQSGMGDVVKVAGGYSAFTLGYYVEKRFVEYEVKSGKLWKQFVKVFLGGVIAVGIKEGLKYAFPADNVFLVGFLRYFLLAAWAALGAPAVFKLLKI